MIKIHSLKELIDIIEKNYPKKFKYSSIVTLSEYEIPEWQLLERNSIKDLKKLIQDGLWVGTIEI